MGDFSSQYKPYKVVFGEDLEGLTTQGREDMTSVGEYGCHQWYWWHNQPDSDPFWEFENPNVSTQAPHWVLYSDRDSAALETGYKNYLANNQLHEAPFNENFSAGYWREYNNKLIMIQFRTTNPTSCRPIFRSSFCWLWNQNNDPRMTATWVPYPPDVSRQLESAYLEKALDTEVFVQGIPYIVNFCEMAQHRKDSTLIRRAVRRIGTEIVASFTDNYIDSIRTQGQTKGMSLSAFWLPNMNMNYQVTSEEERRLINNEISSEKFAASPIQYYGTVPGTSGAAPTTQISILATCKFQAAPLMGPFAAKVASIAARAQPVPALTVPLTAPLLDVRTNEFYMWYAPPNTQLTVQLINGSLQSTGGLTLHESPVLANAELDCPNCNCGSRHNARNSSHCSCPAQGNNPCVIFYCRVVLGNCCII